MQLFKVKLPTQLLVAFLPVAVIGACVAITGTFKTRDVMTLATFRAMLEGLVEVVDQMLNWAYGSAQFQVQAVPLFVMPELESGTSERTAMFIAGESSMKRDQISSE